MPPPRFNCAQLSAFLSHCGKSSQARLGSSIHAAIVKTPHLFDFFFDPRDAIVVWNSLIAMYSKCYLLSDALRVFDEMPLRDTVSWNSAISGCFGNDELEMGFGYFKELLNCETCRYDSATLTAVLSALAEPRFVRAVTMIHSWVFSIGFHLLVPVGNALITACFKCGYLASASKMFDEMNERNIITWTAMISGFAQTGLWEQSLVFFRKMMRESNANSLTYSSGLLACSGLQALKEGEQIHGLLLKTPFSSDLRVESGLMDMYSKCGSIDNAFRIFQSCEDPDEVSLTIMLLCCVENGMEDRAFELFTHTVRAGAAIDANMVSAILGGFGGLSTPLTLGKQIHAIVVKRRLDSNSFVSNGLINMYSKCSFLVESLKCFEQLSDKNSISYNSMIAAFARHGHTEEALGLYEDMISNGIETTGVTFLSLLHACSHSGSIDKGLKFLGSMVSFHGIKPGAEHLSCVIDMLGRAGLLEEAKRLIEDLPIEEDVLLWQALLGASSIHGNSEMGTYAAQKLLVLGEPEETKSSFVSLAKMYSAEGRWAEKADVMRTMKRAAAAAATETRKKKEPGMSWVEIGKVVHVFVVGDRAHPLFDDIHETLSGLAAMAMMEQDTY